MNKYRQLAQKTIKLLLVAFVIVGVVGGVYGGIATYAATIEQQKKAAELKANEDKAEKTRLEDQLNKSGEAEKRYATLMQERTSQNFEGKNDPLIIWLREKLAQFRLKPNDPKSSAGAEIETDKPELKNFPYTINVRSNARISLEAVSDTHIYSLIENMPQSAPGLVRIDSVTIDRNAEMNETHLSNLRTGASTPLLVSAEVEFSLISLRAKEDKTGTPPVPGAN